MFKVLLVRPHRKGVGGVANYYRAVVPCLDDAAFKVISFEIGSFRKGFLNLHPIVDQLRYLAALKSSPDLVHINPSLGWKSFIRDGLFVWLAKRKGVKVLVFFRGWDGDFAVMVENRLKWFFKKTFAKADRFIVLASEFDRKLKQWGAHQPVVLGTTVVDNRLLKDFNISDKLSDLRRVQQIKILYLARLEREKGIFDVIDAVTKLIDRGLTVSLSITGDGPLLSQLRSHIDSLSLPEGCISLLGYVMGDDKIKVLSESHIYCFPSYYGEGLPNSVLEAMAFAMPVITTSVGGLADFFQDGKMGYLVEPKNADQIAHGIESLINKRQTMVQMGKHNHEYACKNLLAPKVAEFLKHNYKKTLET